MTKAIVAALLAASSILPGVAAAQDRGDRPNHAERAERRADRGDAARERGRPAPEAAVGRPDRGDRRDDRGPGWTGRGGNDRGGYDRRDDDRRDNWRRDDDRGRYDRRDDDRGGGWNRPGYGRPNVAGRWSNDWRRDGRYDWNRYRSYNRDAFRLPRYYAPSGWGYGYRRFGVGVRFPGALFGRNYWIADPWAYRLPAAYGPYRWVRYYNDAVLVDVRSGYVVDVIYGIFW